MTLAAILAATILFFASLQRSNLISLSWSIVAETNNAVGTLRDSALDDDARERAAQAFAIRMFKSFGRMAILTMAVCAAPALLLALAVMSGVTTARDIWDVSTSWPLIAANAAVFVLMLKLGTKA